MAVLRQSKAKFVPAGPAPQTTTRKQTSDIAFLSSLKPFLDAMPNALLILNEQRQVVYANRQFSRYFAESDKLTTRGLQLGQVLNCAHSYDHPNGCGSAEACRTCSLVAACLTALKGGSTVRDCHISTDKEGVLGFLDLRISAAPFELGGHTFILVAAEDISQERRRQFLDRIFYHDIVNTTGAIIGLADLMQETTDPEELIDFAFADQFAEAGNRLMDEIKAQQQLLEAEIGELKVRPSPFETIDFLETLVDLYQKHPVANGRFLRLHSACENVTVWSDQALLGRVVANMIKNALEASPAGETVTLGCDKAYDYVRIWVHNSQPIPEHVQLQIFRRSFSTKDECRGLGTYSMKLLSERYLQGRISFWSKQETGTTFAVMVPIEWAAFPDKPGRSVVSKHGNRSSVSQPTS